tara:strand:+ start:93 stop:206 length:114 start_codon:yes stop_codon:yes gene_type:complete
VHLDHGGVAVGFYDDIGLQEEDSLVGEVVTLQLVVHV